LRNPMKRFVAIIPEQREYKAQTGSATLTRQNMEL